MDEKTVFQKIIDRELPATIYFEDDAYIIIKSNNPESKMHLLVIPKRVIPNAESITAADIENVGGLFACAAAFIRSQGIVNFKLAINGGKYRHLHTHLHLHLFAGDDLEP